MLLLRNCAQGASWSTGHPIVRTNNLALTSTSHVHGGTPLLESQRGCWWLSWLAMRNSRSVLCSLRGRSLAHVHGRRAVQREPYNSRVLGKSNLPRPCACATVPWQHATWQASNRYLLHWSQQVCTATRAHKRACQHAAPRAGP